MFKKLGLFFSILCLAVASFAVSAAPALAETYTIKMGADDGSLVYVPDTLTVQPGDTVKFVMNKLAPHNAVFNKVPGGIDKASLSHNKLLFSPGESYATNIPEDAPAGEYEFYCQPHRGAGMVGKLIVEK
ncbi:plastocyanin [Spirulina sp. CS-785/01]|uniref:plastocyanin n=1 Tax=Spirulina sp. CS-785/01 TaxID=3021716 RepID=UPI00232D8731|nr:plastocyanin [Spirulina sp. CS-785/01]MDB9313094.1 plastocyanin [Spirulina sp. CS-785/01]